MAQCNICGTYASDSWDFYYSKFYNHHPACELAEGMTKQEFKKVLSQMFDAHYERVTKQKQMEEWKDKLMK